MWLLGCLFVVATNTAYGPASVRNVQLRHCALHMALHSPTIVSFGPQGAGCNLLVCTCDVLCGMWLAIAQSFQQLVKLVRRVGPGVMQVLIAFGPEVLMRLIILGGLPVA